MFQFRDTGGLFENFEVNGDPFWPKVSRLLAGSVVLHLILVACVIFIPPVRDAMMDQQGQEAGGRQQEQDAGGGRGSSPTVREGSSSR